MTKRELIASVAAASGYPRKTVAAILNTTLGTIIDSVAAKNAVILPGFGTFSRRHIDARTYRSTITGFSIEVPAHDVAFFKPGSRMKRALKTK